MTKYQQKIQKLINQINPMKSSNIHDQSSYDEMRRVLISSLNAYPEYIGNNLHPDWLVKPTVPLKNQVSLLLKNSNYPIVETYLRWDSVQWTDIPYFSWQLLDYLWDSLRQSSLKAGIASYYLHSMDQSVDNSQENLVDWIVCKLSLNKSEQFTLEYANPLPVTDYPESIQFLGSIVEEFSE